MMEMLGEVIKTLDRKHLEHCSTKFTWSMVEEKYAAEHKSLVEPNKAEYDV